jgi:CP family cyanate transporter-like MFS transporter
MGSEARWPHRAAVGRPRLLLVLVAVLLIAANLRSTITGVGPLLGQIAGDLGTTEAALGLLAAIPLIAFAVVSPLAHALSARFGTNAVVLASLIALGAGTVWRSVPGPQANVWGGTVLIGAALAVGNVLLPAVIRKDFSDRVPTVTSLFTAFLSGAGALASGIVVPVSAITADGVPLGWRWALMSTGVLLPLAVGAWAAVLVLRPTPADPGRLPAHTASETEPRAGRLGIWGDAVAWQVLAYMGAQAMTFYMMVTWLAPLSQSVGRGDVVAGLDVMLLQATSLLGSLSVPLLLRGRLARWAPCLIPVLGLVAIMGLAAAPGPFLLWVLLYGLSSGASLATSFSLFSLRAQTHASAARLSGMAQSGGYAIAAVGPVAFGGLLALSGGWLVPLLSVGAVLVVQLVVGLFVGRQRPVFAHREEAPPRS